MVAFVLVAAVSLVLGFGAGRVKNRAKLAAVDTELKAVATTASADVKALVAKIKSKL